MHPQPTGRVAPGGHVVLARTLPVTVPQLWAALTDPARLARWYGPWTGDPTSGRVTVYTAAEDDPGPRHVLIRRCRPPRHLALTLGDGQDGWRVDLDLDDVDGGSALRLTQSVPDPGVLEAVGPGWEYYLDRLVAAETGADPNALDFARDYYPAMGAYYRVLARHLSPPG